jgi:hypothetical protein
MARFISLPVVKVVTFAMELEFGVKVGMKDSPSTIPMLCADRMSLIQ